MREYLPAGSGGRAELEVTDGATVAGIVDAMGAPRRLVYSVLVNGARAGLDDPVPQGAEVTLMPPFAGGS
jgi:molybdopterin converting factor small subunit